MSSSRVISLLSAAALLCSCASRAPEPPTIDSLAKREPKLDAPKSGPVERSSVMNGYKQFIEMAPKGPLQSEARRRLADLELESGEDLNISPDAAKSEAGVQRLRAAIALYQVHLKDYPHDPQNEDILYQLAKAHDLLGETRDALVYLDRLIAAYPRTRYFDEAQFRRGEIRFVLRDYAGAEQAYASIVRDKHDSVYYEKALYKYGWSLFKQNRYEDAVRAFFALLDRKMARGELKEDGPVYYIDQGERELLDDTLRVISLAFSYQGGPDTVADYFARFGERRYEALIYLQLGNLYLEKERIRDAANTYTAFIRHHPDHAMAPLFQENVINAYENGHFPSLVLPAKAAFVENYGVDSKFWLTHDESVRQQIRPYLAVHLRDLATYYHAQARKTKKPEDFLQASRWYRTFLRSFPGDPRAAEMNFLLAESLVDAKHYAEAITEYEATAYNYPLHAKSAEAGYAALVTYPRAEAEIPPAERPAWKKKAIASALQFADHFPNDRRMPPVLSKAAEELFAAQDYPRAAATARRVLDLPGQTPAPLRKSAWLVLGHSEFALAHYAQSEKAYQQALTFMPANDKERSGIVERLAASIYKQGEQQRTAGNLAGAVDSFLRVGRVAPGSSVQATAQYDAAAALIVMKDWTRAASVLEDFRQRFPKEAKLQQGVSEKLAAVYQQSGQGVKAAQELELLAGSNPDPAYRRDTLWQAAELYEKGGQPGAAARAYANYVTQFPRPLPAAVEARHHLVLLAANLGDHVRERQWLAEIVKADQAGGSERTARTRYLAANASLTLAEPTMDAYRAARLTNPLKQSLRRKKRLMEESIKAYTQVMSYQVAEVTSAATFHIAELYADFAQALLKSERPRGLSADEAEQYETLLEEQAYPFEEKAIQIHQANLKQMAEGLYDDWVKKSLAALAKLRPFTYGKTEKSEGYVDTIN